MTMDPTTKEGREALVSGLRRMSCPPERRCGPQSKRLQVPCDCLVTEGAAAALSHIEKLEAELSEERRTKKDLVLKAYPAMDERDTLRAELERTREALTKIHDDARLDLTDMREIARGFLSPSPAPVETPAAPYEPSGGIYVASRASIPARADMWLGYRANGAPIISTWIDEAGEGETADFGDLWSRILREVASADVLVLYAEVGDFPLKGALIEVGAALALDKRVIVCLPGVALEGRTHRPLGSWIEHSNVERIDDVARALSAAVKARSKDMHGATAPVHQGSGTPTGDSSRAPDPATPYGPSEAERLALRTALASYGVHVASKSEREILIVAAKARSAANA